MQVRHLMTTDYVQIQKDGTAREVLEQFLSKRQDLACIMDNGNFIGIVTKYALYRLLLKSHSIDTNIHDVMIREVVTVNENESVYFARELLLKEQVGHAVVVNSKGQVTGVMAKSDLIRGLTIETNNLVHRLKTLMNHLQESVLSVDLDLKVTSINASALDYLELKEDEITDKKITGCFPDLANDLNQCIHTEKSRLKRIKLASKTAIASFTPIKEWNSITGAMVVLKDVTAYETVAKELETTKRMEKILDSALKLAYDGVVITDHSGKVTKVNQGFLALYGFQSQDEVIGRPIDSVAPEFPSKKTVHSNEPFEGQLMDINGNKAILTQMPIIQNGKRIGEIFKVLYQQLEVWKDLFRHMEKLENEISYYRSELSKVSYQNDSFAQIISKSKRIDTLKKEAYIAAQTFSNVLITGESGTGKELFADAIHQTSGRPGAFVKVNCAAIPENLLESEFFGYAEGAFTGAKKGGKPGKFELADCGTLFLDEIGDMPLSLQAKLLRVLQEREFEQIGDIKTRKVDVRIVAATNKDLQQFIQEGKFREDLYYRIHVIHLRIPPLRERPEDIPLLCSFFLEKFKSRIPKTISGLTREAIEKLQAYEWPGNVRQLENVLERAFHFTSGKWMEAEHIILEPTATVFESGNASVTNAISANRSQPLNRKQLINETEKYALIQALSKAGGNRTKAAKILGISRSTLYQKLNKYQIKEETQFKIE
ncbi:PAS modulated Fis family sigma54 specific transcriptional regulator [Melghirimyces profundicolus]|uniref:PAS modulated Fis family sigma54 specific transcriptional regulator n=1 Tax=Melghirimyces profundicolus TaxID=1242148 RepID=A0A2T6C0M6_9BACL|nr:sigma-54-dependent Fis family transcriptional regulator [Melghirimyces profundicolus]PTX61876.1 PAS modulated Fis family sigma54 specific transcriptional regulator [Melghirimyces profundicolus]